METVSAGEARENLFSLVEQVNQDHLPRVITSQKGDAVLLSKEDWDSLQETIYLQSVPGLVDSVREAEQADDWVSEEEWQIEFSRAALKEAKKLISANLESRVRELLQILKANPYEPPYEKLSGNLRGYFHAGLTSNIVWFIRSMRKPKQ